MCSTSERKQKTKYYHANPGGVVETQNIKVLQFEKFKRHSNRNQNWAVTRHTQIAQKMGHRTLPTANSTQKKATHNLTPMDSHHCTIW